MVTPSSFGYFPREKAPLVYDFVSGDKELHSEPSIAHFQLDDPGGVPMYPSFRQRDIAFRNDTKKPVTLKLSTDTSGDIEIGRVAKKGLSKFVRIYSNFEGNFSLQVKGKEGVSKFPFAFSSLWYGEDSVEVNLSGLDPEVKNPVVRGNQDRRYIEPYLFFKGRDYQPWHYEDGKSSRRYSKLPNTSFSKEFSAYIPHINLYRVKFKNKTRKPLTMKLSAHGQKDKEMEFHKEEVKAGYQLDFKVATNVGIRLSFKDPQTTKNHNAYFYMESSDVVVDAKEILDADRFEELINENV